MGQERWDGYGWIAILHCWRVLLTGYSLAVTRLHSLVLVFPLSDVIECNIICSCISKAGPNADQILHPLDECHVVVNVRVQTCHASTILLLKTSRGSERDLLLGHCNEADEVPKTKKFVLISMIDQ